MFLKFISSFLMLTLLGFSGFAQEHPVFISGQEGHATYRIPAVISLPNGTLLAFAEGRVNGSSDYGDINLVIKRSADDGITWSALETIVDYDSLQAGNPAPVVDVLDPRYPQGVVYLFYNTGNNHEYDIRMNRGVREVWMIRSFDLGLTWAAPENITLQVHRPNNPKFNPDYKNPADWRHYANTPGHAFQFQSGKYKGRIFVAANHSKGNPQEDFSEYQAHGFFTDDHGKSFQLSESIDIDGSNESIAAELSHDRMIMSIRNQRGDIRSRILAYSSDGGETWDEAFFESQLPDPVCQGSILNIGKDNGRTILAHSNPSDPEDRNNLSIKISFDEGKTWGKTIVVDQSKVNKNQSWTAYSDLVNLNDRQIGIIYERNNYAEIVFRQINWKD